MKIKACLSWKFPNCDEKFWVLKIIEKEKTVYVGSHKNRLWRTNSQEELEKKIQDIKDRFLNDPSVHEMFENASNNSLIVFGEV